MSNSRKKFGKPHFIDLHVGSRVRLRRILLGMSQGKLSKAVGLTFQQVQKYERGTNRISVSMLFDLSRALDVPVSFFLEDMEANLGSGENNKNINELPAAHHWIGFMMKRDTLELVRAYLRITDPQLRSHVLRLAKAIAKSKNTI